MLKKVEMQTEIMHNTVYFCRVNLKKVNISRLLVKLYLNLDYSFDQM